MKENQPYYVGNEGYCDLCGSDYPKQRTWIYRRRFVCRKHLEELKGKTEEQEGS